MKNCWRKNSMYAIYDLKNNEQCVAIFDKVKVVAKYFNTSESSIRSSITRGSKRNRRYIIIKLDD